MNDYRIHTWDVSPKEAVALQQQLRHEVRIEPLTKPIALVAGCDISFDKGSDIAYGGIVVVRLADLSVVDQSVVVTRTQFPYVPGLLSFRESPVLLEAWERLQTVPDAIMIDGHGYAHPRRFGIACHFGLLVGIPTLGCAKSVLVGTYQPPAAAAGSWTPLVHRDEVVGAAVRTKTDTSPVFVSVGHLIDLVGAVEVTLRSVGIDREPSTPGAASGSTERRRTAYRIPEPTRQAHLLVNALRRQHHPAPR